ncbi:MAG: hypothetical protein HQ453_07240, partial [Actinobacteria bacterium]|nr:hypothetical protein [Actinomycetota bacterium]
MSERWPFQIADSALEQERAALRARVAQINAVGSEALPLYEALEFLRNSEAPGAVRRTVLTRSDIPADVVAEARRIEDDSVRAFAVSLPGTPLDELVWASRDVSWQVRAAVAAHPAVTGDLLTHLTRDDSSVVRRAALTRSELPIDVLVDVVVMGRSRLDAEIAIAQPGFAIADHVDRLLLATDFGAGAVLTQSAVPSVLLRRYARKDHSARVREIALLRGAPSDVASRALVSAAEEDVRLAAVKGGNCSPLSLSRAVFDLSDEVRAAVAACDATPTESVDLLLGDTSDEVRSVAASSVNASPEFLAVAVSGDRDACVRRAAVSNPRCPADAVVAGCHDEEIVVFAVSNPACAPEGLFTALVTLRSAAREAPDGVDSKSPAAKRAADVARTVKEARRRLAPRAWRWLREFPLEELNPEDLDRLLTRHLASAATDARVAIRAAVAAHRDVDDATLLLLASDPEP